MNGLFFLLSNILTLRLVLSLYQKAIQQTLLVFQEFQSSLTWLELTDMQPLFTTITSMSTLHSHVKKPI